jgi:hypothetical protein
LNSFDQHFWETEIENFNGWCGPKSIIR